MHESEGYAVQGHTQLFHLFSPFPAAFTELSNECRLVLSILCCSFAKLIKSLNLLVFSDLIFLLAELQCVMLSLCGRCIRWERIDLLA